MNHTELDLIVAELMFPILVDLAPTGKTIGYKEIADQIKAQNSDVAEIANITQRHIGRNKKYRRRIVVVQDKGTGVPSLFSH